MRLDAALKIWMARAARTQAIWGHTDCTLIWANVIRDALGYDPAALYRGKFWSPGGLKRVLGVGGLEAALDLTAEKYSWRLITPDHAIVGDIGMVRVPVGGPLTRRVVTITAICRAPDWFVLRGVAGFSACRAKVVKKAWAVV